MKNILWIQPDQTLAITTLIDENLESNSHAQELIERGDVPSDWAIAAYDVEWPNDGYPHEAYRWNKKKKIIEADTTYVPPAPPEPTKEELLAQLQALTAKIEAL